MKPTRNIITLATAKFGFFSSLRSVEGIFLPELPDDEGDDAGGRCDGEGR